MTQPEFTLTYSRKLDRHFASMTDAQGKHYCVFYPSSFSQEKAHNAASRDALAKARGEQS